MRYTACSLIALSAVLPVLGVLAQTSGNQDQKDECRRRFGGSLVSLNPMGESGCRITCVMKDTPGEKGGPTQLGDGYVCPGNNLKYCYQGTCSKDVLWKAFNDPRNPKTDFGPCDSKYGADKVAGLSYGAGFGCIMHCHKFDGSPLGPAPVSLGKPCPYNPQNVCSQNGCYQKAQLGLAKRSIV